VWSNSGAIDAEGEVVVGVVERFGANEEDLRFVAVEFEKLLNVYLI